MQASYPAKFVREMGCTAAELCAWLPGASRRASIEWVPVAPRSDAPSLGALVSLEDGAALKMQWTELPARRIALITLPRLEVHFDFGQASEDLRHRFMRHFDLYTQRGGG